MPRSPSDTDGEGHRAERVSEICIRAAKIASRLFLLDYKS